MTRRSTRVWLVAIAATFGLLAPGWSVARLSGDVDLAAPLAVHEMAPYHATEYAPDRVLVRYRGAASKRVEDRLAVRALVGGELRKSYKTMPDVESIVLGPGVSVEAAVQGLSADPRVLYAEPDYIQHAFAVPNDQNFNVEWGLDNTGQPINGYPSGGADIDVNAPEAWDHATGSDEIVIADLDEGFDPNHPDLSPNVWVNPREIAGNNVDDDANGLIDDVNGWDFGYDDASVFDGQNDTTHEIDSHGTHTAGTIGAAGNNGIGVTGVCWHVKLMSLKFLLPQGGITSDAVDAIDYAIEMKQRGVNIRAINASWGGGGFSQTLQDVILNAGGANILFVAAAGNGGQDSVGDNTDLQPSYPSCYNCPNIISVGAFTRYNLRATYSNYGATTVDLFAPGTYVASTWPGNGYVYDSGTSMSAPHVTGTVGLIASIGPALTGLQIKQIIMDSTVAVPNLTCITGGRLDLRNAIILAILRSEDPDDGGGDPPPPPPPPPPAPDLDSAHFGKKTLTVTGANFHAETSVVEIDGVALPVALYPDSARQADGSYTQIEAKAPGRLNYFLPKRRTVQVTVYDTANKQRSSPIPFKRN